jgi:nicotinate-nucleotide pyrophosphorylase
MFAPKLPDDISETVRRALAEDVGTGDLTAGLIPADAQAEAQVITREDAVLCGAAWFNEVFRQVDGRIRIAWRAKDGDAIPNGHVLFNSGFAGQVRFSLITAAHVSAQIGKPDSLSILRAAQLV